LPWEQLPAFLAQLRAEKGTASRALEFAILTASRTGEVRGMRWNEVDMAEGVWVVPADRMKAGRLHRVPISPEAAVILTAMMSARTKPDGLVFESAKRGVPLSDMALLMVVRRMNKRDAGVVWKDVSGRPAGPHGFRSTFRVWTSETTSYPREVVEAALARTLRDKVEAAYARTDLMERRRPLMKNWGTWAASSP
jgi:integrase